MKSGLLRRLFYIQFYVLLSLGALAFVIDKVAGRSITEEKIEAVWAQIFPVKLAGNTISLRYGFRVAHADEKG